MASEAMLSAQKAVQEVVRQRERWAHTSLPERAGLLEAVSRSFQQVAPKWVELSALAKEGAPDPGVLAEEWLSGPVAILRNLYLLRRSLLDLAQGRAPGPAGAVTVAAGGQAVVEVLPADPLDRIQFPAFSASIWMQPGVTPEDVRRTQASSYSDDRPARAEVILGAGNVSSIAVTDVLYKLFVEGSTAVLKTNPVLAYLNPLLEEGFRPLLELGVLRLVAGDAEVGRFLSLHPEIAGIHVTGAEATHASILSDLTRGEGGRSRKRLTSELGNVSPVIVVPGDWSDDESAFQAANLASMIVNNAGFNCNAARVLIQPAGWSGSERFLNQLRTCLDSVATRRAYYPGARERFDLFVSRHPQAELFGDGTDERLPWALVPNLDPERPDEICFRREAFCGLMAGTRLPSSALEDYLEAAVRFCNERLWGTLNATLLVPPAVEADPAGRAAVEAAIRDLRYGTVCVNHWAGIAFAMMTTPWGGFPGQTLENPQSGIGVVHNTPMFERPQKTVVRGPFYMESPPPWFVTGGADPRFVSRLARMFG